MRDLKLDDCHDLDLDQDLKFIDDRLEVLQNVNIRLLIIKFRWAFDYLLGVPWQDGMFDVRVPLVQKDEYLKQTIIGTIGVRLLLKFVTNFDRNNRGAQVNFEAETSFGPISGEVLV